MKSITRAVGRFMAEDEGAALVEYGLLIALIAVICVIIIATLGNTVSKKFSEMNALYQ